MRSSLPIIFLAVISLATSCKKGETQKPLEPEVTPKIEIATNTNINNETLLKLVNEVRLAGCNCGSTAMPAVPALTWNANLGSAAIGHSAYMQSINKLQHESANGATVGARVTATGYVWRSVGENVAQGQTSEAQVVNDWIKSESHCKNVMNASFKEMGAARAGIYWTQVFAVKL